MPAQHASPLAPHAWHTVTLHASPTLQTFPGQQACNAPPHPRHVGKHEVHMPSLHASSTPHVLPAQHGWFAPPHSQDPFVHTRLVLHELPQHG